MEHSGHRQLTIMTCRNFASPNVQFTRTTPTIFTFCVPNFQIHRKPNYHVKRNQCFRQVLLKVKSYSML